MKTCIWKFELLLGTNLLNVPCGAVPLTVQIQGNKPVIYYELSPYGSTEPKTVFLYQTGEEFDSPTNAKYLGTLMFGSGGHYVLHCYVTI